MADPTDYTGNSKKDKEGLGKEKKKIESVVTGEVVLQKKSLGRKVKDLFVEADFKGVTRYIFADVLIPSLRNMIVDASTEGIRRIMYGERAMRYRGPGGNSRITYNNPIHRSSGYSPIGSRNAPPVQIGSRSSRQLPSMDYIISSKEEAELVLERLNDVIDTYDVATVADLHELIGIASSHTDQKWGWVHVGDAQVRQVREGYLIDLPSPEPIQ